jgi:hypothetical protein
VNDYQEVPVISAGKRCGVNWTPWMGDWFVSHSPRNGNSNAEGPWDHWVDLAIRILRDPMTAKVRPEAHAAAAGLEMQEFYDEANVHLDDEDLRERFTKEPRST